MKKTAAGRLLGLAFLLGATAVLTGCGQRITNSNIDAVNQELTALDNGTARPASKVKGITPKEVEAILGQPTRIETFKIPLETQKPLLDGVRYYYEQDGHTVVVHFVDNKLISPIPRWDAKPESAEEPPAAGK